MTIIGVLNRLRNAYTAMETEKRVTATVEYMMIPTTSTFCDGDGGRDGEEGAPGGIMSGKCGVGNVGLSGSESDEVGGNGVN